MKKSKLIELLNQVDGDPEIVLWNGMVGDWMDVDDLVYDYLYKITKSYYTETVRMERTRVSLGSEVQLTNADLADVRSMYRKMTYEVNPYVTPDQVKQKKVSP